MFHRIALVPIGMIEKPAGSKLVFASEGEGQNISFDYRPEDNVYFRCRAISADVTNGNGDKFPEEELVKSYKSFIGVGLYKDHDSGSVDKSIGKVLWAEWIPDGKYVECYCAVDKKLAPDLAHRVKNGIVDSVSMGCSVQEAECSICGNVAHNINELCPHMTPGSGVKGRRDGKGEIIAEINRGIQFNELSLVTVPADSTARVFEIYAALNKRAEEDRVKQRKEEEEKKKNPLLRDKDATWANLFNEKMSSELEKLEAKKAELEKSGADTQSEEYRDVIGDIKWLTDRGIAQSLASSYMALATPTHVLMYDQYKKMKADGVPDSENPFSDVAAIHKEFENNLVDYAVEAGYNADNPSQYQLDPSNPGAYGQFMRWLMHSNLPDGLAGPASRLSDTFKDGSDPDTAADQATDTVQYRRNFIEAKHNGLYTGMMTPEDFQNNKEAVTRAFRDSVMKSLPARAAGVSRDTVKKYLGAYFDLIDNIQSTLMKAGPKGLSIEQKDAVKKMLQQSLSYKSYLRGVRVDPNSKRSIWDVVLDRNQDYLGLRKDDPSLKSFLRVEEPPKSAPKGLENLVGKKDAIDRYLELSNSPIQKTLEKHMERGLPMDAESLYKKIMHDNGLDEEEYGKILSAQGFTGKWSKVSGKLKSAIHDYYFQNKPFNKGQQQYFNTLLENEGVDMGVGGVVDEDAFDSVLRDQEKDPWSKNRVRVDIRRQVKKEEQDRLKNKTVVPTAPEKQKAETPKKKVEEVGLTGTVMFVGDSKEKTYPEFAKEADSVAKKILGVKPYFSENKTPGRTEIDWVSLFDNVSKLEKLMGGAPESWKDTVASESANVAPALKFIERYRYKISGVVEDEKSTSRDVSNAESVKQAAQQVLQYVGMSKQDLGKVSKEDHDFLLKKLDEYTSNKSKIDELAKAQETGIITAGHMQQAAEYYLALKQLHDHIQSLGADKSSIGDKAQPTVEAPKSEAPQNGAENNQGITGTSGSVARLHNKSEALNMGLKISFKKGKNLKASYFIAEDGSSMYRVAASDVLPLVVQQAINANDPDVTTPGELVGDLQEKYASLHDFKRWAKRRRSKNKKAAEKYSKPEVSMQAESKSNVVESTGRNNEMPKSEGLEKAAAEETKVTVTPVTETAPVVEATTEAATAAAPAAAATAVETPSEVKEIKAAFEVLLKFVEAKLDKKAVLTENPEPKIDGKGKSSTAPMPSGIKEVSKTESPKGHVSASLKVEAMDENWSVNEKELEAEPKKAKPAQSMPMLMSVDSKEVASEQMTAKVDNKAASTVKKYYNQLGSGATGEPAKAIDAKSSQSDEVKMLRAALAQEKAEKEALIAKANLNAVADKIYDVVASLRAKNLLPKGKEEAMVDALTQKFASVEALDGLKTVLETISPANETVAEEAPAAKVVPQTILESAQPANEDAATLLSQMWNK